MKNIKKLLIATFTCSLLIVSGCSSTDKNEEKTKEVKIVENSVYEAPKNPSEVQGKLFNQLSKAIEDHDEEKKVAELVAKNFAFDFLTLSNKVDGNDIGGLTYLPESYKEEFALYAKSNYYNSYATIVKKYDMASLPKMKEIKVNKVTPSQLFIKDVSGEGYMISLTAKYENTELSNDALKTSMTVQVMKNEKGRLEVIALD